VSFSIESAVWMPNFILLAVVWVSRPIFLHASTCALVGNLCYSALVSMTFKYVVGLFSVTLAAINSYCMAMLRAVVS